MSQDDMQPASPIVQAAFTRLKAIPAGQTVLNHDIIDDCDCVASYLLHTKFDDNSADILDDIQNGNVIIKIKSNETTEIIEKKILKRDYKIQRIDGLPKKHVTPPPEVYERIKKDNILIGKARSIDTTYDYFKNKFINPVDKYIITGVYGSQRILNGKPRRPHYGIDFHAPEGTPVKAMMDGEITLAERDMYFTGGTIIFDHGHGISTLYMHMKEINVKVGQKVKQGDIVGTLGKSGRATGPHLDIRLNWFEVKLDPASVLNLN